MSRIKKKPFGFLWSLVISYRYNTTKFSNTMYAENVKSIKCLSVRRVCRSAGPTCPIFCRSGHFFLSVRHKITLNNRQFFYRSDGPTSLKICRSGRIFVGPGPTDRRFSYSLCMYISVETGRCPTKYSRLLRSRRCQ